MCVGVRVCVEGGGVCERKFRQNFQAWVASPHLINGYFIYNIPLPLHANAPFFESLALWILIYFVLKTRRHLQRKDNQIITSFFPLQVQCPTF